MSSVKAIIFGATGAVGRAAALEAQSRGAKVTLAMRNTKKPIPGFTPDLEKKLGFTRVQADLSDPKSIERAVSESGATVAFSYILFEAEDGLLETYKAMKRAGITHVVLLSSFCVTENGGAKPSSEAEEILAVVHGKAELALAESGIAYTVIRPAYFSSNIQMLEDWEEVKSGQLELAHPDAPFDYLAPEDVGALAGARVAAAPPSGELIISQCGPELLSQRAAWKVVSEGLGMDISIREINSDEHREKLRSRGFPEPMVKSAVERLADLARDPASLYEPKTYKEASMNFRKYTGRQPTTFKAWVDKHREELLAN
ncbi:hypothetical protein H9Q72_010932 [Fusarium xylarioides]|uniref:NAD(P)-binding domain-containing protein n=1 Tax=Fusarium xylarioides TaxID=221167 RepID=A0A9P7IH12_9HYPO|nr:hypothetical protein H9Q72_010932 [Fusarium xylarioides]KAG5802695.1 hypothetical protein H9Q71_012724 [Fusarium xylarioides]KAG5812979.1 hypothetical protein H9Q74_012893 [Fusarium xylarioides]